MMDLTSPTPSRLVVTCAEPTSRILTVTLALGFILLAPVVLPGLLPRVEPLPDLANQVLSALFLVVLVIAVFLSRYSESYTFDRQQQIFIIEQRSLFGRKRRSGPLSDICDIHQETHDDNDALREYVVLHLRHERLRLPLRLYSFSARERQRFGQRLGQLLGMPLRIVER